MPYNVLIADDSATMRAVVKKALGLARVEVGHISEAANGREALEILQRDAVDLLLVDLNMPEMGGDVLLDRMQSDERLRSIPVVIISTEGSRTRLDELMRPEVVAFLRKPFSAEQFYNTVTEALTVS